MTHGQQPIGHVHTDADEHGTRFCLLFMKFRSSRCKLKCQKTNSKQYPSHAGNWIRFDRQSHLFLISYCVFLYSRKQNTDVANDLSFQAPKLPQPLNYDFIEGCKCFLLTEAENNSCSTAPRPSVDKCQMVGRHEHKDMIENWLFNVAAIGIF